MGVLPAHVAVQLESGVPHLMILCWYISNVSEALIGAYCIRQFIGESLKFDSFRDTGVFVICAAILAPFLSSFLDAGFVALVGWKDVAYWQVWRMRFIANVLAELTLVPFIVLWGAHGVAWFRRASLRHYAEASLLIGGLLTVSLFVFSWQSAGLGTVPALVYLPLPFLIWAAVRFGPAGASISILVVVLVSIWGATEGHGPFIARSPAENVLSLQLFLIAISLPLLLLASLVEERREKAEALSESEARFRSMADTAPVMIWMSGINRQSSFFNKGWLDFTGRKLEEELGDGWAQGVHREDVDRCRKVYVHSFAAREEFTMEYRLRRSDGEYRWVIDHGVPRFARDGMFLGYIGTAIDITERKTAQETLEKERAFLRQVIDVDPNFIFAKDREGRFTLVNQAVADAYGTTVEGLIGKTDADFNPNCDEVDAFRRIDLEVINTRQGRFIPEECIMDSHGKLRWMQTVKRPIIEKDGSATQVLAAATDITQRKQAESELQRNRQELAHVARLSVMGELAASLAHELNQPLTAILSNAQAAQRFLSTNPGALEEVREILGDIVQDNNRAGEVIRRMRTLVKKGELEFAVIDLENVIGDVVALAHSDAILHNVRVSLKIHRGLPRVRADRVQLQQVLLNLLLNAFDAMKDCSVNEREIEFRASCDDTRMVTVAVRDGGVGLGMDQLDKIFQPFYTTKPDGLGMGLSISQSIIEAHGGRLWAENNPDRGSTFSFTVPVEESGIR
jgi:PAS domain S-box-containing protein